MVLTFLSSLTTIETYYVTPDTMNYVTAILLSETKKTVCAILKPFHANTTFVKNLSSVSERVLTET
jgi:hypothetical protein